MPEKDINPFGPPEKGYGELTLDKIPSSGQCVDW